jgi:nucleotide sugar dehydrogenase
LISVIGHKGVVGSATFALFQKLGYEVTGADKGDKIEPADIYFICVPEDAVKDVMKVLPAGLVVVRSSVPPMTCEHLSLLYQRHICHNPEFLHQDRALIDIFNPDSIVIGECCREHGDMIEELYMPLCRQIVRTETKISEMVKLTRNNYGACVISFWNEIEAICQEAGINGHKVGMIASLDPIICAKGSRLHKQYGGACLPKDLEQMIRFAWGFNFKPRLLTAVKEVNDTIS